MPDRLYVSVSVAGTAAPMLVAAAVSSAIDRVAASVPKSGAVFTTGAACTGLPETAATDLPVLWVSS